MKRLILITIFVLGFVVEQGWCATIYVEKDPENTGKTRHSQNAFYAETGATGQVNDSDLEAALSAAGVNGILIVAAGSYATTELDASDGLNTTHTGQTIRNVNVSDPNFINYLGTVIFDGTGLADRVLWLNHAGYNLHNVTLQNAATNQYNLVVSQPGDISEINILNGWRSFYISSPTKVNISNSLFKGASDTTSVIRFEGTCIADFSYCIFQDMESDIGIILIDTITFYQCVFAGFQNEVMYFTSQPATVNIINCIATANGLSDSSNHLFDNFSGTPVVTVSYSMIQPNTTKPDTYRYVNITEGAGNINTTPLNLYKLPAIWTLSMDDMANLADWTDMADYANGKGFPATFCVDTDYIDAGEYATLSTYVAAGNEVASHARHHQDLTQTVALTIDGPPTGLLSITTVQTDTDSDNWTGVLTVEEGTGNPVLTADLTSTSYDTLAETVAAVNGLSGWTCTKNADMASALRTTTLAALTAVDVSAATDINVDQQKFLYYHIDETKRKIEANITGYTCDAFMPPGGWTNETVMDAVKAAGYTGSRVGGGGDWGLDDIEIYKITGWVVETFVGANTVRDIHAAIDGSLYAGRYIVPISHGYTHGTSKTYWEDIIDTLYDRGVSVKTFSDGIAYIKAGSIDADGDGERWTRTPPTFSSFKVSAQSDCVNAGVDIPSLYGRPDFYGDYQYKKHNIGVSEKAGTPKGGSHILRIGSGDGIN